MRIIHYLHHVGQLAAESLTVLIVKVQLLLWVVVLPMMAFPLFDQLVVVLCLDSRSVSPWL